MERSLSFYRVLLLSLGYVRLSEIVGERGERVAYVSVGRWEGSVSLRQAIRRARRPV